ncbi:MAG: PAC2 family protein [Acidimicrobiales bacterium]
MWETANPPELRRPILVTAWDGLFDVGGAATGALATLRGGNAAKVGYVDADEFFDFNERRPTVRFADDGSRRIDWPRNDIYCLPLPDRDRDLVLMEGVEPHLRWRTFVEAVLTVVDRFDVKMVVTLGAMIAETPHTRPPTITGSTTDVGLATLMRLDQPSYQGPTGVVGVLHERLDRIGIPAVSLRASVPHYVSGAPNPKASRALLERFERVTGLPTRWAALDADARDWEHRVDEAMADDDDVIGYVRRLEARYDAHTERTLPNADDLAAEFERFLRQNDEE